FNYVGDSILGHKAHLGAGVILSNVRLDHGEVIVRGPDSAVPTGLRKFGAIVGDRAEIGCNSVLSPGSLVGRDAVIYPGVQWKGVLPANSVAKLQQQIEIVRRG
ncbi:MAG: UDP-N-acetylglucosamine diphosphorylase, partial [Chthoniobacterales bacterium]|nr:UDP-N-acetylglucosamine diphosphorylase [Chthoniobacterales bacterium]